MPRIARWCACCALLLLGLASVPQAVWAVPRADLPTPTATPPPPTATPTPGQPSTATPTPAASPTPTGAIPPTETPTSGPPASPTPPPPPGEGPEPSPTPEPSVTPSPSPTPTGDPRVIKTAEPSSGRPGDTIVFSIVVRNDSPLPATNVEVNDDVPGVFQITGATVSQGTITVNGQNVHAVIGTVEPGQEVVIRITTVIRANAAPGQVDNIALLTTDTPGDDPGNNTSTATVTILGRPATLPRTGGSAGLRDLPLVLALLALLAGLLLRRSCEEAAVS